MSKKGCACWAPRACKAPFRGNTLFIKSNLRSLTVSETKGIGQEWGSACWALMASKATFRGNALFSRVIRWYFKSELSGPRETVSFGKRACSGETQQQGG